jgi:hypothetical protein
MTTELLVVLEENKELMSPETYQRVIDNFDKIPDDAKNRIFVQLQNAMHLKNLIDEYDRQMIEALKDALLKFRSVEDEYEKQYNEAMQRIESQGQNADIKDAESFLNNI